MTIYLDDDVDGDDLDTEIDIQGLQEWMGIHYGKEPQDEKKRNARKGFRKTHFLRTDASPILDDGMGDYGISNGTPYFCNHGRIKYYPLGFQRSRYARRVKRGNNGKVEFAGQGWDEWSKPYIQGKHSREWEKEHHKWEEEAWCTLKSEDETR